jgi:hypothetical protein
VIRGRSVSVLLLGLVLALLSAVPARAVIGPIDDLPGATLLIPYFEVDLDECSGNGITTELTVSSTGPADTVVHVTI